MGVVGQNDIWVMASWPSIKNIIRGKVVACPKSGPWWILWVCICPWLVYAPECSNYALTNFLCRSVWIIDLLVNLCSPHLEAPSRPSTLEVLWAKEHTQLLLPLSSPLNSQLSPSRSLGCVISKAKEGIRWVGATYMAQEGATISSLRRTKGIDVGVGTIFAKCATIYFNTT